MKKSTTYQGLAGLAAILIIVVYFLPMWHVALQSIQYPKSMYPRGIRIDFKFNGVYNGCKGEKERSELAQGQEGANCLREMNAINHFIGMYHIVPGVNEDRTRPFPIYYVFDTQKNAKGEEIIDPKTNEPIRVNVTPKPLMVLDAIMHASPYIFVFFVVLVLLFMFTPKRKCVVPALISALLPFYFLGVYIYYLYWYGHHLSMHGGGAFRGIKPFMPTVFGEGKVAQFTTQSYPYFGFILALLVTALLVVAIIVKKNNLKENNK